MVKLNISRSTCSRRILWHQLFIFHRSGHYWVFAYAVQNDILIHQMDFVTAFLNGNLDEEIYMQQPEGYTKPGKEHLVCKLKKYHSMV